MKKLLKIYDMKKLRTISTVAMLFAAFWVSAQDADAPTISIVDDIICQTGDSATINISGNLNSADKWYVFTGSCGGTLVDSTTGGDVVLYTNANTTYYIWGDGATVAPGPCDSVSVTYTDILNQSVALDNNTFECVGSTVNVMLGGSQSDVAYIVRNHADGTVLSTQLGTGSAMDIPVTVNKSMDLDVLSVPISGTSINSNYINLDGGNDYIQVPHGTQLDLTDQFIISFKFRSTDAAQTDNYLLSKGFNRYAVLYGYVANTIELFSGGGDIRTGSQITVPDTDWHHYVYAYDGVTLTGYIDGVEVVNVAKSITFPTDAGDFFIGAANAGTAYSACDMDNVEIWNQYNATRLSQLISGECSAITDSTGLAVLYLFEDGSGTTATDQSTYSNHGTLTNMTLASAWKAYTNPYNCITCSEQLSQIVSVTINGPTVVTQPVSTGACLGEPVSLFVETSDVVDSIDWQADDGTEGISWNSAVDYPNVSFEGDSIHFSGITTDHHEVGFRAIIYKCGSAQDTSEIATLSVHGYSSGLGITVCDEYVTSDGRVFNNSLDVFMDTLAGASVFGCDSIFRVILNVFNEELPHRTIYPTTCTYVGPSGTTYTGPGIVYDTLVGADPESGCDSIIAIDFRPVCDTVTEYRLLAGTNDYGNGNYYFYSSVDSTRFTEKATSNNSFQAFTVHPGSGYLHAVIDSFGDGNTKLYEFNPFSSEMTLLYDFPESYIGSADYGPDGTLYFVYGLYSTNISQIWKLDSTQTSLEFISDISSSSYEGYWTLEYFDPNGNLRMYEYGNGVYEIDITTGDYTRLTGSGLEVDPLHPFSGAMAGTYYNSTKAYVSLVDMLGTFYMTDETGLNGREVITDEDERVFSDIVEFNTLFPMQDTLFVCPNESIQLSVRYHANTVHWYKDGIHFATNMDTIYATEPGTYRVMHQIGTQSKWVWSEEKVIEAYAMPELNLSTAGGDTLLCPGESIQINSGTGGVDFQWYLNGNPIAGANEISYTTNMAGHYNITKTNELGCIDSADVALILYDAVPTSSTQVETACDAYTWPVNGTTYNATGMYQHTLTNAAGCDSIITLDLTINLSNAGDTTAMACGSFEWYGTVYTESTTAMHTLTNAVACDSIVTLDLTINHVINTVNVSGTTITADEADATYQWLNCDDYSVIDSEISQSFTPAISGNYAIRIEKYGCVDTSECVNITITGIEHIFGNTITVYPNPTNGQINIDFEKTLTDFKINIRNIIGKLVYTEKYSSTGEVKLQINGEPGIYFVEIIDDNQSIILKVIKTNHR